MNSVGSVDDFCVDDGCLGLPVHLSFIVQETIGDLAPASDKPQLVKNQEKYEKLEV